MCIPVQVVLEKDIERLIVVSSASVTRPYAPVGILLNTTLGKFFEHEGMPGGVCVD